MMHRSPAQKSSSTAVTAVHERLQFWMYQPRSRCLSRDVQRSITTSIRQHAAPLPAISIQIHFKNLNARLQELSADVCDIFVLASQLHFRYERWSTRGALNCIHSCSGKLNTYLMLTLCFCILGGPKCRSSLAAPAEQLWRFWNETYCGCCSDSAWTWSPVSLHSCTIGSGFVAEPLSIRLTAISQTRSHASDCKCVLQITWRLPQARRRRSTRIERPSKSYTCTSGWKRKSNRGRLGDWWLYRSMVEA